MTKHAMAAKQPLTWGTAGRTMPGESISGDRAVVQSLLDGGTLLAVFDGAGHGSAAAEAAEAGRSILERHAGLPLVRLFRSCHDGLRGTRGCAMSAVLLNGTGDRLSWIGIGNVEALVWRPDPRALPRQEHLLLRGGLVGCQMPIPFEASRPVRAGDVIVMATDGIRGDFTPLLNNYDPPQRIAERIVERHATAQDDALVLVARARGAA
ncbi:MAG TPA: SpoIIE family protein phosphatase [Candidatus Polarisedimenticolia bacterium]|nr:SpoIIE family protein phosphatase [Candidatus Polarisedimenticolia bacterium]